MTHKHEVKQHAEESERLKEEAHRIKLALQEALERQLASSQRIKMHGGKP